MLRRTFLHLPGVGETTERRWWSRGLTDWQAALGSSCTSDQRAVLEKSICSFEQGHWAWFDGEIGNTHKWRAWGEFADRALFVDIETDGGYGPESITLIGTFDGHETRAFLADENLQDAADHLEAYPLLVTYNGVFFDMPLLRSRFPHRLRNHFHLDLRFPLHRLGIKGGLKRIEKQLGLSRSAETDGLDGWDAVRLWREWQCGSREACELLLAYNAEDVKNLHPIAQWLYTHMRERLAVPAS